MKNSLHWTFTISLVLAATCWGLGGVMSKSVVAHVPPLTLLVAQLTVSITFLWAAMVMQKTRLLHRREVFRLGLTGVLNPGLAYTFSLIGLTLTTASMSALLWATEPIVILGLAWLVLRERLTPPLIIVSAIAIIGVALVVSLDANSANSGSLLGNLLIFAGVCCCAYYTVISRRQVAGIDPLLLVAVQQTFALAWALAIWPIELLGGGAAGLAAIKPDAWLWAAVSGITYYALAFWFYITGLKRIPASMAGMFINLVPIFGIGGATIFLGERLDAAQWAGAVLILAAVIGVVRVQQRETVVAT